jgi:protein SCO1/2
MVCCADCLAAETHLVAVSSSDSPQSGDRQVPKDASTKTSGFDDEAALQFSQSVIGKDLSDIVLLQRDGKRIHLSEFRGKPLVISLVYTSCFHICPAITQNLARAVEIARRAVGEDAFIVVTIGFDYPKDRPETMRAFARQQGLAREERWKFLSSPDKTTIQKLTRDLGFIFFASPKGFDHLAQTTIIDAGGKVYRQIYGQTFDAPLLVEPLKELLFGNPAKEITLSSFINKARLWCTVYDPATGSYQFNYAMVGSLVVSFLVLMVLAFVLVRIWLKTFRRPHV